MIREFVERIEEHISAVAAFYIFFDAFFFFARNPNYLSVEVFIELCIMNNEKRNGSIFLFNLLNK